MKKSIFGFIVALVLCTCTFSILYVTDIINFKSDNNTNNNTPTNDKLICKSTKKLEKNNYNFSVYNIDNNILLVIDTNGTYLTSLNLDLINFDKKLCNEVISEDIKRTFISSDDYNNYYLYTLPNDRMLVIKSDKSDKYFSLVLDLGRNYQYGIVNYDKHNNFTDSDVETINTFIVKDNYLYEYDDRITVYEYKYEFKDNNYTKTKTDNLYYCTAGCKS